MDRLRHAKTRSLDEFETAALAQLWHDEDTVISEDSARIRMLGALRAMSHCCRCHDVERGQLLGAFSYELRLCR